VNDGVLVNASFQYNHNLAALMPDVDYDVFVLEPPEDKDMYTDDEGLQRLIDLIETKLQASITRQTTHTTILLNGHL
jgi:hypothetical protein